MRSTPPDVYETPSGTRYLKAPGIVLLASTMFPYGINEPDGMYAFLHNLDPDFDGYLADSPHDMTRGERLIKLAGQLCYLSFGARRTMNAGAQHYFENILESGHGSVLEHASASFLFYGVSRSLTHELVRHRHLSFSQVSQRYVGVSHLRFVERPEFQEERELHEHFLRRIDRTVAEYREIITRVSAHGLIDTTLPRTEQRKALQQIARACLPNETEAPIIVSGNLRAWRGVIDQRANPHAETEIRQLIGLVFHELTALAPKLFADYNSVSYDGAIEEVTTEWRKV